MVSDETGLTSQMAQHHSWKTLMQLPTTVARGWLGVLWLFKISEIIISRLTKRNKGRGESVKAKEGGKMGQ